MHRTRTAGPTTGRRLLALSAVAALGLAACTSEDTAGPEEGVDVEDVQEAEQDVNVGVFDPQPLLGDEITVSGEVSEVLSANAFRIAGDEFGDEGLGIVTAGPPELEGGAVVQVTGIVRERDTTTLEDDLGVDLTDDSLAGLDDVDYVVAASDVERLVPSTEAAASGDTIPQELEQAGAFGTLVSALSAAGLTETLIQGGPFTLLAPDDAAFEELPEGQLDELLNDPEQLAGILRYHVIEGDYGLEELEGIAEDQGSVPTLSGETLELTVEDDILLVDGVEIDEPNFEASNGIFHSVPEVLVP